MSRTSDSQGDGFDGERLVADVNAADFSLTTADELGRKFVLIAKAVTDCNARSPNHLSFQIGDEITHLNRLGSTGTRLWEGKHAKTGTQGLFVCDTVQFLWDPVPEVNESTKNVKTSASSYKSAVIGSILVLIAVVSALYYPDVLLRNCDGQGPVNVTELKSLFTSQDPNMWDMLRAGLLPSRTEGVQTFLFLHNSPSTAECFIRKISGSCCTLRRAKDVVNSEAFVSSIKADLKENKCMVIYDLEKLAPEGALVLKGLCDAYAPVVLNSKFYFAFNAGPLLFQSNERKLARELLETMWTEQQMAYDDFGGTLTRLTQNVLKLSEEKKSPC